MQQSYGKQSVCLTIVFVLFCLRFILSGLS